ncbi:MAG: flagellin [Rhodobacteraceae bacterium]|nr:MAG: flagellin [Paracoccaceae bacterium]
MSSILTNTGAMVALQTMRGINKGMQQVQSEISTGKSVGNARDNAAVWAISKTMESDVGGLKALGDSLALGKSTVGVARVAAETTVDLMKQMQGLIVAAQEENVDRDKIQADLKGLQDQIEQVLNAAQFNGLNLVNGEESTGLSILSSLNRDNAGAVTTETIDIALADLDLLGDLDDALDWNVSTSTGATTALEEFEDLLQVAIGAAATFGTAEKRIDIQSEFIKNLSDALTTGIGALVDADMEEASARLQALQVQQQLATQSLSIANQAPQNILALFR